MESGIPLVAVLDLLLGPLEVVDEGRVGSEQVPGILEQDASYGHLLRPGKLSLPDRGQAQKMLVTKFILRNWSWC